MAQGQDLEPHANRSLLALPTAACRIETGLDLCAAVCHALPSMSTLKWCAYHHPAGQLACAHTACKWHVWGQERPLAVTATSPFWVNWSQFTIGRVGSLSLLIALSLQHTLWQTGGGGGTAGSAFSTEDLHITFTLIKTWY